MADDEKPKMEVPREEWAETDVHKASSYACGKCGKRFEHPDEVYAHIDAEHRKGNDD